MLAFSIQDRAELVRVRHLIRMVSLRTLCHEIVFALLVALGSLGGTSASSSAGHLFCMSFKTLASHTVRQLLFVVLQNLFPHHALLSSVTHHGLKDLFSAERAYEELKRHIGILLYLELSGGKLLEEVIDGPCLIVCILLVFCCCGATLNDAEEFSEFDLCGAIFIDELNNLIHLLPTVD